MTPPLCATPGCGGELRRFRRGFCTPCREQKRRAMDAARKAESRERVSGWQIDQQLDRMKAQRRPAWWHTQQQMKKGPHGNAAPEQE